MIGALAAAFLVLALGVLPARAADAEAGKAVFQKCQVCHAVEPGKHSPLGPSLHGVYGRRAASVEGFKYSDAMKQSGIVWDDDTLARFLRDPKGTLPGNRMAFPGIKDDQELADLLAYLKQASR